jgi:hypothetical protein
MFDGILLCGSVFWARNIVGSYGSKTWSSRKRRSSLKRKIFGQVQQQSGLRFLGGGEELSQFESFPYLTTECQQLQEGLRKLHRGDERVVGEEDGVKSRDKKEARDKKFPGFVSIASLRLTSPQACA